MGKRKEKSEILSKLGSEAAQQPDLVTLLYSNLHRDVSHCSGVFAYLIE